METKLSNSQKKRYAELAKKQRTRRIIFVILIFAILTILAPIGIYVKGIVSDNMKKSEAEKKFNEEQSKGPDIATSAGGLFYYKGKIVRQNELDGTVPNMLIFSDFLCPVCGLFERTYGETKYFKLADEGKISVELHPISFMDESSTDDYSTRAATFFWYIAQNDPDHAIKVFKALYAEKFQPSENSKNNPTAYKSVSNADLVRLAVNAGVSGDVAQSAIGGKYKTWVTAVSEYVLSNSKSFYTDGNEFKGTPWIIVGKMVKNGDNVEPTSNTSLEGFDQEKIDKLIKEKGGNIN